MVDLRPVSGEASTAKRSRRSWSLRSKTKSPIDHPTPNLAGQANLSGKGNYSTLIPTMTVKTLLRSSRTRYWPRILWLKRKFPPKIPSHANSRPQKIKPTDGLRINSRITLVCRTHTSKRLSKKIFRISKTNKSYSNSCTQWAL